MIRRPPKSPLFPYPTLSRSSSTAAEKAVLSNTALLFPATHSTETTIPFLTSIARPILAQLTDRKSTRLNSSHLVISYAVFCLKKKKKQKKTDVRHLISQITT